MRETHGDLDVESRPGADRHNTFDPSADDVAVVVLDTVAAAEGVQPVDLAPISTALDPDALDALFSDGSSGRRLANGKLVFTFDDYEVTVTSDGDVWVRATK